MFRVVEGVEDDMGWQGCDTSGCYANATVFVRHIAKDAYLMLCDDCWSHPFVPGQFDRRSVSALNGGRFSPR